MRISVVIPARNEAEGLMACLLALEAQTRRPDEILVVDNQSCDDTARTAVKLTSVKLLSQTKIGRVHARNTGFDAATGDIIARIDADSIVPPDWLSNIEEFYANGQNQLHAWTGGASFGNVPMSSFVSAVYNWLVFDFNRLLIGHYSLWGSNMALPRTAWQNVRDSVCRDNAIHEDLDLSIHLRKAGYAIHCDKSKRVVATMRRVLDHRGQLWPYLRMWPNTLRHHRMRTWVICWLVGVLGLFIASYMLVCAHTILRLFAPRNRARIAE